MSVFISLETSSLTQVLLRSVLFSFTVFGDFPAIFLLLISSLILLKVRDHTLYGCSSFKFVAGFCVCVCGQHMVYFGIRFVGT